MATPRHIAKAAEAADAKIAALYTQSKDGTPATPAPNATAKDPQPAASATPDYRPEASAAPSTDPQRGSDPWETKFKVLQGKYNAEVPRLHAENRQLREDLDALKVKVESASAKPANVKESPDFRRLLDDLGLDEESGETLDGYIASRVEQATGKVRETVESFQQQSEQTRDERFWSSVYRDIPNYDEVAYDPDVSEWLAQTMPLTGNTRRHFLDSAFAKRDAANYVAILKQWRDSQQGSPKPNATSAPEHKVVPSKARSEPTSKDQVITAAEYQAQMRKAERLAMKGHRERADEITKSLDKALAEGRVKAA